MAAKLSGPGGGSKFAIEQNHEINVTPFVDVMLVLLIIFMVAAPLATVDVEVALPPENVKSAPYPQKPIFVTIKKDGSVYLGNDISSVDSLSADIHHVIGRRDPAHERVFIRGDKETRYGDFMHVMNALQDDGFYEVALVGQDSMNHRH
jgi:biopolymer transport protein ExbD/biopolymer transport protein TolR